MTLSHFADRRFQTLIVPSDEPLQNRKQEALTPLPMITGVHGPGLTPCRSCAEVCARLTTTELWMQTTPLMGPSCPWRSTSHAHCSAAAPSGEIRKMTL